MPEHHLRIFVSSPGDVDDERRRVDLVAERLNAEFTGRVRLKTVRWETSYYSAHETFQKQIPEAVDCDVVVAIFRSRLGTELPASFTRLPSGEAYPSGTAYEVLTAIDARKGGGQLPDIYVFRYPDAPSVVLDARDRAETEAQWNKLTSFFERWFRTKGGEFIAAFQEYRSVDRFAEQVEDCLRQWLFHRGFVAPAQLWDRGLQGSPFPGLSAYGAHRAPVFFGRDLAVAQAITRFRRLSEPQEAGERPFLLIIGASGAGKSSFLQAGLIPTLTKPGTVPDVDLWRTAVVMPDADPFATLAAALLADQALGPELRAGAFGAPDLLAAQLAGPAAVALLPVRAALDAAASRRRAEMGFAETRPARLALGLDQAERLFAEAAPEVVTAFAALLYALVRDDLAYLAVALRSDAYPRFQAVEALAALRHAGATLDLLLPTRAELEEIVTRPVATCHPPLTYERKDGRTLASVLVADAEGGDALPLLQLTLSRLYDAEAARGNGLLMFTDYRGMAAAVTETGNAALARLDAAAQAQLPALIAALLSDVLTDPATGERVPVVAPLDRRVFEGGDPARMALVDAFVTHRLLVSEGVGAGIQLRPVHEALLRIWPRARAIVAEIAALVQVRHALSPLVRAWAEAPEAEKPRHLDLSPALLSGAQQLLDHDPADLPSAMRSFAEAAIAAFHRRQVAERQRQHRLLAGAVAALVVVIALATAAAWQWRLTDRALVRERAAHAIALSQAALRDGRLLAAVREARGAYDADPAAESRSALFSALNAVSPRLSGARQLPHGAGTALAWIEPGTVVVGLASGGVARVPVTPGAAPAAPAAPEAETPGASRAVAALQRLADGQLIALRRDATCFVLPAGTDCRASPDRPTHLTADPGSAMSLAADPADERVAVASMEAGLVMLRRGERELDPTAGEARIRAVAFSPEGGRLARGGDDGAVTVADSRAGATAWTVAVGGPVLTLAWSHDGRWLAAGTGKGGLALIDAAGRSVSIVRAVTDRPVSVLAWNPRDDRLAFNCGTLLLCIGRPPGGAPEGGPDEPIRLNGHQVTIRAIAWAPDGTTLASLDTGGQIYLWSMDQNEDVRFALDRATGDDIMALASDPRGPRLYGGSSNGAVYAWTPLSAPPRRLPAGEGGGVESLALSGDGRLAAARSDGGLSVWPSDSGAGPTDAAVSGRLSQVRWAPDDGLLAVLDPDRRAVLLRRPNGDAAPDGGRCADATGDTQPEGLTWAAGGRRLYVSVHGAIRICDPESGWRDPIPTAGDSSVAPMSLSTSRDGRWLATTGGDAAAALYDLDRPSAAPRSLPTGAGEPVFTQFSPDGQRLAVIATDGTLSVWARTAGDPTLFLRVNLLTNPGEPDPNRVSAPSAMTWVGDQRLALAGTNGAVAVFDLETGDWARRLTMLDDRANGPPH